MEQHTDLQEIIEYLNPSELDYQDWVNVGMALKHEGYSVEVWDAWSKNDHRYHAGECEKKWNTFHGSNSPVTAGTIVQLAMDHGWKPSYTAYELGWDDEISAKGVVVDRSWVEGKEIHEPRNWNPVNEITRYLETLFDPGENVGYVTGSWERTDDKGTKYLPQKGCWDRTAGQLIEALIIRKKLVHGSGSIHWTEKAARMKM